MTDCIGAPAREWLERYVDGTLPEAESERFENHYFDCAVCLAELQAVQAAQEQLRLNPVVAQPRRARVLRWPMVVSFGAMAAALVGGYLTLQTYHQHPGATQAARPATAQPSSPAGQPGVELAQLADLHLPSYHESTLRGEGQDAAFERGMKQYEAGDCAGAATTLAHVAANNPNGLAAQFYSGACRMRIGDYAAASDLLQRVADAGDSPQQESAWYYLAQIALIRSDSAAARQDLNHVIALHGDLESQAGKQLARLDSQSGHK